MKDFTVSCIQFAVRPLDVEANVAKSREWLARAMQDGGPDLVVFQETVTTGFHPGPDPSVLRRLADRIPGRLTAGIQEEAARHRVHVVWPTYEIGEDGNMYNSAAVIGADGTVLGVYRKTHPFPTEQAWTTRGGEPTVVETALGKLGLVICYDGDFPELCRAQALAGAEIIVRPSALLRDFEIWSLTNRARAYDNQVWFLAVNTVGADAGGNYYFGHSMVVNPLGQVTALARGGEQIITARIEAGCAATCMVQHLRDRNTAAYRGIA